MAASKQRASMSLKHRMATLSATYSSLKGLGHDLSRLKFEAIHSPTQAVLEGRSITLFGTNNYLGLTFDTQCIKAAIEATRAQGTGTTGSRIANGTYQGHRALEVQIAAFYGKRSAIVFSTGYTTNLGTICGLATPRDHLLIDKDSHASIYDGCQMSGAQTIRFRHNNAEDLAKRLDQLADKDGDKFIIVEGIYSMLGDHGALKEIAAVKREAPEGTYLIVDEAHSLGVLGANGRGKCEVDDVEADCDFIIGTFSKSMGTTGGFCVSDLENFDMLKFHRARTCSPRL